MSVPATTRGRVAVIGAGPAGMAAALSIHQAGHEVTLLERYPQARPAGNILNLWPPPIKALGLLGVDTDDLGAPCCSEFRSATDHAAVRAALDRFEGPRKPHTARQVQQAYVLGKVFHHAPRPLQRVRDAVLDRTPFLQKAVGESSPGEVIAQIAAIDETEQRFAAAVGDPR